MIITTKKQPGEHRKRPRTSNPSTRKISVRPTAQRKSAPGRREDAAERKKIGGTLDTAAFVVKHRRNSASSEYWETQE